MFCFILNIFSAEYFYSNTYLLQRLKIDISNYRPVSLLSSSDKIPGKPMESRLYNFLDKNNLVFSHTIFHQIIPCLTLLRR